MKKLTILVLFALICLAQAGNFRMTQSSNVSTAYQFNSANISDCDPSQSLCPCDPSDPSCTCWSCFQVDNNLYCYWTCDVQQ
ncbi:hypothetical protein TTHERM_000503740 (macronuclear) [Tetrahymena thermophila SB210]|uniref:Transmembrane protein n=1 Tax=Tetrahymena thermophila (strain SB210) TaxID=312017 RepID=W7XK22_TETTS|nr:hypothetical protein TTHERM_000503740 [Tetrahymena thermophila SB210]EWS74529.1 hypothetical protein TTHERM_000503740 [Tetrahymena thermophila SB210]|eukprot:XP_012652903.1 hypothetical protein TTHERM_000503740 [Tetrahymena thermophila SB210]